MVKVRIFSAILMASCASAPAFAAGTPSAPEKIALSKEFKACLDLAKEVPDIGTTTQVQMGHQYNNYVNRITLSASDSAMLGCFVKFANIERFSYPKCYAFADSLPTPYAKIAAQQVCFDYWSSKGSLQYCNWAADHVVDSQIAEDRSYSLVTSAERLVPQGSFPFFSVPKAIEGKGAGRIRCSHIKYEVVTKRLAQQERGGFFIDRTIPNRPLSEAEAQVCSLEASLLATNYEILRARRSIVMAPLVSELRKVLGPMPRKVRGWVSMKRVEQARLLLEGYSKKLPASSLVTLNIARGVVAYKFSTDSETLEGEIAIHAALEDDEREIQEKVLAPLPGGWKAYFKKEGTDGCPSVESSIVSGSAVAQSTRKPLTPEAYESSLATCDPLKGECGAGVIK